MHLNRDETDMKAVLLKIGFIEISNETGLYKPVEPKKALITFTEEQKDNPETPQNEEITPYNRKVVLSHEISHGEYSTNQMYHEYCRNFWFRVLNRNERTAFRDFFKNNGIYDTESLIIDEMQANLVHTPFGIMLNQDIEIPKAKLEKLKEIFLEKCPISCYL